MENAVHAIGIAKPQQGIGLFQRILICGYFLISFFEPYLNGMLGSLTKYYIFLLMGILCVSHRKLKIKSFHWCFLGWLIYKFVSALWSLNTYIFESHLLSQIGMVALLVVLTAIPLDRKTGDYIVNTMWIGSTAIGLLSLFMSHPYHGIVSARQVLYLFGQEADPNNQAAFLLVGLSVALYNLIVKKERYIFSVATIAINAYSLFLTGSRGGLIGLVCIVLALFIVASKGMKLSRRLWLIAVMAIVGTALYSLAIRFLPEDIFLRLFSFDSYEGGSERDIIWKNGWKLLTSDLNFVFGAGWGAYYGYNGMYVAMHNTFLSMLCDVGIMGCLLFFVPIVTALLNLWKRKNILPILLLTSGFVPSFFIEAINKRFFWNVIIFLFIAQANYSRLKEDRENEST